MRSHCKVTVSNSVLGSKSSRPRSQRTYKIQIHAQQIKINDIFPSGVSSSLDPSCVIITLADGTEYVMRLQCLLNTRVAVNEGER